MADFHFIRPYWLLALIPAVLIWWGFIRNQDQRNRWRELIDPHLLEHLLVGERKISWFRPVHILLFCWIVTVLALTGPAWQREPSPFLDDEAGLMVLLKVSESMESTDVQPSRLERAKYKLRDVMDLRKGASTGLIVYSGSAHLVMPLTRDDRIINAMLEDVSPDLMPVEGDVLSEAIKLGEQMVIQSGLPGSLLVIADIVAPAQTTVIASNQSSLSIQFLSILPTNAPVDPGLQGASQALSGSIVRLSVDTSDAEEIARRAKAKLAAVSEPGQGERWKDNGYLLLPLTALCMLLWFRRGWVL